MASNGILPARDAGSHALQLGTFLNPDMPGSFNELVRDVSQRANVRVGTAAQRAALPESEKWPGLCWIDIPDNPLATTWTPALLTWTGTGWRDPNRIRRVLYVPRSQHVKESEIPLNGNLLTAIVFGTWNSAPAGQYLVDFIAVLNSATAVGAVFSGVQNTKTLRADYQDRITPDAQSYQFPAHITDHPGGNLEARLSVLLNGSTGTIFTNGSGVRFTYLGPLES